MKNKITLAFLILTLSFFSNLSVHAADTSSEYKLLESVPLIGEANTSVKFPEYMSGLYKFSFVAISIAALLMITIGGFWWLMSAGNQAQASTSKKMIEDALWGLAIAFLSWVILNTINPDILSGKLDTSVMKPNSNKSNDGSSWTDEDQRKFDEGLDAAERLESTDWDQINSDIDEIKKAEEERQNREDIFTKPEVDPNRETDGLTDEERQKIIDDWYKENYGDQ